MNSKNCIYLFEDSLDWVEKLTHSMKDNLDPDVIIRQIDPNEYKSKDPYEDIIYNYINSRRSTENTILIVSDRDLSGQSGNLSESAVSTAAARLGIPIALYAEGYQNASKDILEMRRHFGNARIVLSRESMAQSVPILAKGFAELKASIIKHSDISANAIAQILKNPEVAPALSMYGIVDAEILAGLMGITKQPFKEQSQWCSIGYWIIDALLKYPGLLVNELAAASYLNIAPDVFASSEVQTLFEDAIYNGPFAGYQGQYWWRGELDEIIFNANAEDGRDYASKLLGKTLDFCRCRINNQIKAGYYCMSSCQPVSLEESCGSISWFPRGADLARITKNIFEEQMPWMEL